MESLYCRLREFIPEHAFYPAINKRKNGQPCVTLYEKSNPKSSLTLKDVPENIIIIKADSFFPLLLERTEPDGRHYSGSSFFIEGSGAAKRADFIILDEAACVAIFLELKGSTESEVYIREQLIGAHAVFDYIKRVISCPPCQSPEPFFNDRLTLRFACVCNKCPSMSKRPTSSAPVSCAKKHKPRYNKFGRGDSISNILRINATTEVYYRQLNNKI